MKLFKPAALVNFKTIQQWNDLPEEVAIVLAKTLIIQRQITSSEVKPDMNVVKGLWPIKM